MGQYLYNGEQFQDINSVYTEDLKKVYPFALIQTGMFSSAARTLFLFREDAYYFDSGGTRYFGGNEDTPVPSCSSKYDANSGTWNELLYHDNLNVNVGGNTTIFGDILWSNFDVLNEDGSIYLAASDPIPVSTFTPDPVSLTMGWLVGRRIAGQRGKKIEPEVPSGVYDDTFPIEWNTLAVQGNPTVTCGDLPFVKVSNLTPTAGEMAGMVIASTFAGGSLLEFPYTDGYAFDLGHVANYGSEPVFRVIVVTTAGQSAETECDFPKTGIYVENYGLDGTDISIAIKYAPKTPIAYLYNGVQLPDINTVWTDKETYPYAVIRQMADGSYCLYLCSAVATYGKTLVSYYAKYPTGSYCISYNCSGDSWISDTQWLPSSSTITVGDSNNPAMWSNHDIMNTDGTTYLAASDPVPVYES